MTAEPAEETVLLGVIGEDGEFRGVYRDDFRGFYLELGDGKVEMPRASEVEWNGERQLWEARKPDGTLIAEHESRPRAIELEVRSLEAELRGQPYDGVLTAADVPAEWAQARAEASSRG